MKKLITILILVLLSRIALGADYEMCQNEVFRAQFSSVNDANEPVETTLLGESWPQGTVIDDVNDIVTFSPEAAGVFHIEVSLEPINGCWEPKKRIFAWDITVNPIQSWTTEAVVSVESK